MCRRFSLKNQIALPKILPAAINLIGPKFIFDRSLDQRPALIASGVSVLLPRYRSLTRLGSSLNLYSSDLIGKLPGPSFLRKRKHFRVFLRTFALVALKRRVLKSTKLSFVHSAFLKKLRSAPRLLLEANARKVGLLGNKSLTSKAFKAKNFKRKRGKRRRI